MSGIGMTTLAQLSYNESDDMVMKTIAQRVITSRKFENDNDLDFIQLRLKKALIKKRIRKHINKVTGTNIKQSII